MGEKEKYTKNVLLNVRKVFSARYTPYTPWKTRLLICTALCPFPSFKSLKILAWFLFISFLRLKTPSASFSQYILFVFQKIAPVVYLEKW